MIVVLVEQIIEKLPGPSDLNIVSGMNVIRVPGQSVASRGEDCVS